MDGERHIEFIARGVLIRGNQVLLCQNTKHGYFYLPGGHVEFGESARAAVEREFLEETGARMKAGPLLLVSEGVFGTRKRSHHEVNLLFHVEQQGGRAQTAQIKTREEGITFSWMDFAAVPEADIRPLAAKAFLAAGGAGGGYGPYAGAGAVAPEWVSEIG